MAEIIPGVKLTTLPSNLTKSLSDAIGTSTSGRSPTGTGTVLAPAATSSPTASIQSSGGDILTAVQVDPKVLELAQADKKAAEEKAKKEEEAKKKRNLYILGGVGVVGVVALAFYMSNRD